ncbi:MAG: hypothetical protein VB144_03940 [Clostridia bacterium]|nr:hypothetical protein [Clostridia bacterium]
MSEKVTASMMDDPIRYLLAHDGGSHRLSLVLLKYFDEIAKPAEGAITELAECLRHLVIER